MTRSKQGRAPTTLGKSLVNQKKKKHEKVISNTTTVYVHTTEESKTAQLQSHIDRNELDEFLTQALLSQQSFAAERDNVQVIMKLGGLTEHQPNTRLPHDPSISESSSSSSSSSVPPLPPFVGIPRRPGWSVDTSASELDHLEREAFLEWRRSLALIEQDQTFNRELTPYEKNLQVWKQLWRVLERCSIVIQIVDARNPLLFRCQDLEVYTRELTQQHGNKRCLLVVNKADYLTRSAREKWSAYFREHDIDFVYFSAHAEQIRLEHMERDIRKQQEIDLRKKEETRRERELQGIIDGHDNDDNDHHPQLDDSDSNQESKQSQIENEEAASSSTATPDSSLPSDKTTILTRTQLLSYIRSTFHNSNLPLGKDGRIQVGMVGYPNVGKSSSINVLVGAKKVTVGATPGKTKHFQTLNIDDDICICDCPGLVFPTFLSSRSELVCNGILPIDQLKSFDNYTAPVDLLVTRVTRQQLLDAYGLYFPYPEIQKVTGTLLLQAHAKMRGWYKDHGRPDEARSARIILKDFVNGKLLYCHPPDNINQEERKEFMYSYFDDSESVVKKANQKLGEVDPQEEKDKNNNTFKEHGAHDQDVEDGQENQDYESFTRSEKPAARQGKTALNHKAKKMLQSSNLASSSSSSSSSAAIGNPTEEEDAEHQDDSGSELEDGEISQDDEEEEDDDDDNDDEEEEAEQSSSKDAIVDIGPSSRRGNRRGNRVHMAELIAEETSSLALNKLSIQESGEKVNPSDMSKKQLLRSLQRNRKKGGKANKSRKRVVAQEAVGVRIQGNSASLASKAGIVNQKNNIVV